MGNIDFSGKAAIYTANIYGNRDVFCEVTSADSLSNADVTIIDPFVRVVKGGIPPLTIDKTMQKDLEERGFAMQVAKRYGEDALYSPLPVRHNTFLVGNKTVYHLDDYTRFPVMEEVFTEFVSELRIRRGKNGRELSVLAKSDGNAFFSQGYSLIMIDGVPVFNHEKLISYDPLLIKDIEIFQGVYSIGNLYFEGVACFKTYKGNLPGFVFDSNVKILPFSGEAVPMALEGDNVPSSYPDYRQTLLFQPLIEISSDSLYSVKSVTPLYGGMFEVVVEGMTASGAPVYSKTIFVAE